MAVTGDQDVVSTVDPPEPVLSRATRALLAFVALVLGWGVGGGIAFAFEGLMVGGRSDLREMSVFVMLMGLFALGGWAVSALPLALFGSQRGLLFAPFAAPAVGGVCGVALLAIEMWIFFDWPPRTLLGADAGTIYLLTLGGLIGATTWWTYTSSLRRWTRRR